MGQLMLRIVDYERYIGKIYKQSRSVTLVHSRTDSIQRYVLITIALGALGLHVHTSDTNFRHLISWLSVWASGASAAAALRQVMQHRLSCSSRSIIVSSCSSRRRSVSGSLVNRRRISCSPQRQAPLDKKAASCSRSCCRGFTAAAAAASSNGDAAAAAAAGASAYAAASRCIGQQQQQQQVQQQQQLGAWAMNQPQRCSAATSDNGGSAVATGRRSRGNCAGSSPPPTAILRGSSGQQHPRSVSCTSAAAR